MRSIRAVLELVRWRNALIAALGVLLGAWWADGAPLTRGPLLAAAAAIALAAFANAFNDCHDVEIDRVAHPDRPLPSGRLRRSTALAVALGGAIIGVACATLVSAALGALTILVVLVMREYSVRLKRQGFGNLIVAVLASLPFLYGAWSAGHSRAALPLLALAVPLHFAREVAKDLEDAPGDAAVRRTLPVTQGPARARGVFVVALLVFVAVLIPFALARPLFALLVLPAVAMCGAAAWRVLAGRHGSPVLLKSAMLWAMAALVAGGA